MGEKVALIHKNNLGLTEDAAADRPAVTFALFAYNQERFIREAVEGAFSQDYSPLEIILSDDCSTDKTFEIMKVMAERYEGPHQVIIRRSTINKGLLSHINSLFEIVNGKIIVVAAGDDISLPNRTSLMVQAFSRCADLKALYTDYLRPEDKKTNYPVYIEFVPRAKIAFNAGGVGKGATYAYHRNCFDTPGPLPEKLLSEDRILPLRAAQMGVVGYLNTPTVICRVTDASLGANLVATGRLPARLTGHIELLIEEARHFSSTSRINFDIMTVPLLKARKLLTSQKSDGQFTRVSKRILIRLISFFVYLAPKKISQSVNE